MLSKDQISEWIKKIDEQRAKLHVGGGALISANYSKVNNELYGTATALRNLLVLYYSYESIDAKKAARIRELAAEMQKKASDYTEDKTKGNKMAPQKGDKKTRYDAANELAGMGGSIYDGANNAVNEANNDPEEEGLSENFKKVETKYFNSVNVEDVENSGAEVMKAVNGFAKESKLYMKRLDLHYRANMIKADIDGSYTDQYSYIGRDGLVDTERLDEESITKLAADFKANIASLHRLSLLRYENDEQFLNLYKDNRNKIRQVVAVHNWLKNAAGAEGVEKNQYEAILKKMGYDSPDGYVKSFMAGMGLKNTPEDIEKMSDRISTFEMIGRRYDNEMDIYTNHAFATMSAKDIADVVKMKDGELENKITALGTKVKNGTASVDEINRRDLYAAVQKNRELAEIGVKQVDKGYKKAEASYVNREVGDKFKRRFKFLNASARMGRKSMLDYYAGDIDIPVCVKAKIGKVSLKYNNQFKYADVSAGTHVGVLGARAVGNVGISLATKDPLNWPKFTATAMGTAEAYGARGVAKGWIGGKYAGFDARVMGHAGYAKAEGGASVGYIYETDDKGKVTAEGYGVSAKAGATASVFQGKVTTGINILGIMVRWETEGYALGIGAKAEAKFTTGGCKLGAAGCLGFGAGFFLVIDWRGFKDKLERWKKRRGISKKTLKQKQEEAKNGRKLGIDERKHSYNFNEIKSEFDGFADDLISAGNKARSSTVVKKGTGKAAVKTKKKNGAAAENVKKRSSSVVGEKAKPVADTKKRANSIAASPNNKTLNAGKANVK